ncbi:hypothetical protein RJT34_32244 [Clitoria ternatea]|uniref:Uncharacterized protein n=1 Tax=Clitoria ternatea TaxID=43366 RepID=A0AAN9EXT4_CLITE
MRIKETILSGHHLRSCYLAVVYCYGTRQPSLTFRSVGRGLLRVLYTVEVGQKHCRELGYAEARVCGAEEGGIGKFELAEGKGKRSVGIKTLHKLSTVTHLNIEQTPLLWRLSILATLKP